MQNSIFAKLNASKGRSIRNLSESQLISCCHRNRKTSFRRNKTLKNCMFFSRQNIFLVYLLGSFIVQSMKSWHQHSKQIGQNQITRKETKKNICKYFFHYSFKNGDCFQCVFLFIFKLLCLTFCSLIIFLKNALEEHKTKSNISFLFRK